MTTRNDFQLENDFQVRALGTIGRRRRPESHTATFI